MDPTNPGPEEHGPAHSRRPPRESLIADFAPGAPAPARMFQLLSGDLQLTVNPVDGSEIEPCPPADRPGRPRKRTADERAGIERAARPPAPPGPAEPALSLLERQDERERLVRLLARGRSVRLTGPAGSGRTALLDLVAEDCLDLAPDGVVRLNGHHRTAGDLLHDLFHAVYDAPRHRPDQDELHAWAGEIGAVVVLDDLEFGGAALDELLDATPECAFLFGATPDVPAPSAESDVEEIFLTGLDRAGGVEILERTVGRVLTEEEANWAGDLWFESEGLPLRFIQAGALLRQRDQLRASTEAVDEYGVFQDVRSTADPAAGTEREHIPLPSLGEAAAPAPLLASRLGTSARAALRFAVALGGEVPHQAHLPALVGDTHADAALAELAGCGLVSPAGSRYRLAAGVQTQLEAAGYADDAADRAVTAAQHYAWWAGHPSVTPERVCAEADAVLAALAAVVPQTSPPAEEEESTAVRLARTAAPAFAAGLHWSAWERALRSGAEASRMADEVSEKVYFHHELGILALCAGQFDRARAELEASGGLRGALADKRGAVAGRRALALLADRTGDVPGPPVPEPAETERGETERGESAWPPYGPVGAVRTTQATQRPAPQPAPRRGGFKRMARRNMVAAGSGALLAAVLGTVVTLGMTSPDGPGRAPAGRGGANPSASQGADDGGVVADPVDTDGNGGTGGTGSAAGRRTSPGPDGTYGTADDPAPPADTPRPSESVDPSGSGTPSGTPSRSPGSGGSSAPSSGGTTGGTTGSTTGGPSGGTTGSTTGDPTGGTSTGGTPTGGSTGTTGTAGSAGTNGGGDTGTAGTTGGTTTGGSTDGSTGGGTTGGDGGGTTTGASAGGTSSSASASRTAPRTNATTI
ncbi:ATP-binding protein [Streptomyces dangxiongensis]|uniref:ATP-binding protein n=1 Tax=Streptomyces dangxiongensis TaxID=1442032 RepID=A0A3G2JII1_9ACTN|nr:ATP-binding protein [Streptomyces dangxiongensis]AYN39367.1 ATP-binding protein [Streptomyces dangxiongensis]